MSRLVLVLGMHRSGTSVAARLLAELGVHLGPAACLMPAREDNPKGFFEHMGIVQRNDKFLAEMGAAWDHLSLRESENLSAAVLAEYRKDIVKLVENLGNVPVVAFKDPRMSVLWRYCADSLESLFDKINVLLVMRSPLAVAASLYQRDHTPPDVALMLWRDYNQSALAALQRWPGTITYYEDVLLQPHEETLRIMNELSLTPPDSWDVLMDFLDPALNHGDNGTSEQFTARSHLAAPFNDLYTRARNENTFSAWDNALSIEITDIELALRDSCSPLQKSGFGYSRDAMALRKSLHVAETYAHDLERAISLKDGQLSESQRYVEDLQRHLDVATRSSNELACIVESLQGQLTTQQQPDLLGEHFIQCEATFPQSDASKKQSASLLAGTDRKINKLLAIISEQEGVCAHLDRQLSDKNNKITQLQEQQKVLIDTAQHDSVQSLVRLRRLESIILHMRIHPHK